LQSDPLKLGSCKFNVIINIINITLRSDVAAKLKTLGYKFIKIPNIFRSGIARLVPHHFLCKAITFSFLNFSSLSWHKVSSFVGLHQNLPSNFIFPFLGFWA
jgi:hypothetical protein